MLAKELIRALGCFDSDLSVEIEVITEQCHVIPDRPILDVQFKEGKVVLYAAEDGA